VVDNLGPRRLPPRAGVFAQGRHEGDSPLEEQIAGRPGRSARGIPVRHGLRRLGVSPASALLALALMAVHGLVVAGALMGDWNRIFQRLYVQVVTPPFADLRTIPAAAASAAAGMDPLLQNPFDPWGRPMNYPRLWVAVGEFIGPGRGVVILGAFFAAVFSAACAWIVATQKTVAGAVAVFLVAVSASTWLAIERGNNDLLVFGCVTLALYLPWRWRGVFLGLAVVLKIFPLAAVFAKSL